MQKKDFLLAKINNNLFLFSVAVEFLCLQFIAAPALAAAFDVNDKLNLKIYTAQGYYINTDLRSQIPFNVVLPYLDKDKSPTCASLKKANAPYLSKINILPLKKMRPEDFKLYSLVQEALIHRGMAAPRRVYRGAKSCDFLIGSDGAPVKYFLEKAFLSTSVREEVAQRFTVPMNLNHGDTNKAPSGCLIKIDGLSGVAIADATGNYNQEDEILFPAGALFEVTSFQKNGQQKLFNLKEIDRKTPAYASLKDILLQNEFNSTKTESYPELAMPDVTAGASNQLNIDAQNACHEAYLFFTSNPDIRKKLNLTNPAYDLEDKILNANDYSVDE
jgi:hypothetical protein